MKEREPRQGDRTEWLMIAALVLVTIAWAAASIVQIAQGFDG